MSCPTVHPQVSNCLSEISLKISKNSQLESHQCHKSSTFCWADVFFTRFVSSPFVICIWDQSGKRMCLLINISCVFFTQKWETLQLQFFNFFVVERSETTPCYTQKNPPKVRQKWLLRLKFMPQCVWYKS